MIRRAFSGMHPILEVVFFFSLLLTGMAVAMGLGMAGLMAVSGDELEGLMTAAGQPGTEWGRTVNVVLNAVNQLLAFGGVGLFFHWLMGRRVGAIWAPTAAPARPALGWGVSAGLAALALSPLLDLTYRVNRTVIEWTPFGEMVAFYEDAAAVVTKALLTMPDGGAFVGALVAIAFLPALCEEIAFRGVLMPRLVKATGSVHVGVWLSAALFSAVHMQFFGFVPRMVIGAGLGYLVVHSGRLWPAVVGHFVNNASAVVAAWWLGEEWLASGLEPGGAWEAGDWAYAGGSVIVLAGLWMWWQRRARGWTEAASVYEEAAR